METQPPNWEKIKACLKEPFKPREIQFRLEGPAREAEGRLYVRAIPFVAAHAVQSRLDEAVGIDCWAFRWSPVALVKGRVVTAKGTLSLHGRPPKEEEGRELKGGWAGETAASDALRRCAALYGVGRYLSECEALWVAVKSGDPKSWLISQADEERLRAALPCPLGDENAATEMAEIAVEPIEGEMAEVALGETEEVEAAAEEAEEIEEVEEAEEEEEAIEEVEEIEEIEEVEEAEETMLEEGQSGLFIAEADESGPGDLEPDGETERSATITTVESVHPDKVRAIRQLCADLEEEEPADLETMAASIAEEHLERLMVAWGKRQQQRATLASRPSTHLAATPSNHQGAPAAAGDGVSNEVWARYVKVHNEVRGHDPDMSIQKRLKESTVLGMIAALEKQAESLRSRQQSRELTNAPR